MGFDFSVGASAIFGVDIEIPYDLNWSEFAKRLDGYDPCNAIVSIMSCHNDCADSDEVKWEFDMEDSHKVKWEFDFEKAGQKSLDKILGKGHGLKLRFCLDMGCMGEACYPATLEKIFLFHSASEIKSQQYQTEGVRGCFNAPWVCLSTPIPTMLENHDEIVSSIEKVLTSLGLETQTKPGWQFVTIACGG